VIREIAVPTFRFELRDYAWRPDPDGEVEQWRFDDSRTWHFGGNHRVVACRDTGIRNGFRGHIQIDRDFDVDEPPPIAFLVSVWVQLYEAPF
jgi:hypothetical protein